MVQGTAVAELLEFISRDTWRESNSFSADLDPCQTQLLQPETSRSAKAESLREWLSSRAYPCIFGRIAAKRERSSIIILEERDLLRSDVYLGEFLREGRLQWKREALEGRKHAFIFVAVSPQLAFARPDINLLRLATRLCELYFGRVVEPNRVLRDELLLRPKFGESAYIRWQAGVDNFAASGDGRWWHDHRIPGGVGFVINSVGHMARSLVEEAMTKDSSLREEVEKLSSEKLTKWALPFAMRTILTAQEKSRIPGTRLARADSPDPRLSLPPDLASYRPDYYHGWYHTDETVRAEVFAPEPSRPENVKSEHKLDFMYLQNIDEEDYRLMSLGERIMDALGVVEGK